MKKTIAIILSLLTVLSLCTVSFAAERNETITHTLDLASVNQNTSGPGYDWNNLSDHLTLNNIRIETEDEFGLTIPADALITLEGDNYVKASSCAATCLTSATFQGNGTLTLISDDIGIRCLSLSASDIVRFRGGKINITTGEYGIFSEFAAVNFSGADVNIKSTGSSVKAEDVKFTGGKSLLEGAVISDNKIVVSGCDLTVASGTQALSATRGTEIGGVGIYVGENAASAAVSEEYGGEKYVCFKNVVDNSPKSVLFGGNTPKFVDYIIFVLIFIAAVAVIAVPIIIKKKKTEKLIKANEEAKKAAKAAKK